MKINGSLVFDASSASEIHNLRVEKVSTNPVHAGASDQGRLLFNTTDGYVYVGTASAWVSIATGGNAASLQTEVDAIEASLGAALLGDGTFNASAITLPAGVDPATSITDALNKLAAFNTSHDQLSELTDVNLSALADGQYLKYNFSTGKWVNDTVTLSDITDITTTATTVNQLGNAVFTVADLNKLHAVTSSANELNVLTGIPVTLTATELGYTDGVTSPIQAQLDGKQPLNANLTSIATQNTNGILVLSDSITDTWTTRSLVAPTAGFTITNADGSTGNPTFTLANDLAALEALTTTGYVVRTGDGTAATRTISGQAGRVVVTNGDGVASNTDIDLATVTQGATGNFVKVTLDSYGRVSGNTPVVTSDITALVGSVYVDVAGDSMASGANLTFTGGGEVLGLPSLPSSATAATSKAYVDSLVSAGATWRNPIVDVDLIDVVTAIPGSPVNGGGYIKFGGTQNETWGTVTNVVDNDYLYYTTAGGWKRVDTLNAGDRFIIAGEHGTIGATLSGLGFVNDDLIEYVSGNPNLFASWSLPHGRGAGGAGTEIAQGTTVLVGDPDSNHFGHTYLYDAVGNAWIEIAGPGSIGAGIGLSYDGNTMKVNVGAGIAELPTDEVGIDLFSATGALILTLDGSTSSTDTNAKLHLHLTTSGGLAQDATGLHIPAAGVTNAMLQNASIGVNSDSGTGTVALGQTFAIFGTSTQGITTTATGQSLTISATDATTAAKGVAKFDPLDFTVTAGMVSVKAAGIDNAQLANDHIFFAGTTGSSQVVLGGTLNIVGSTAPITTSSVGGTITIDVADATTTAKGLASFDPNHFSTSAGAVSLVASLDDLTNVSGTDTAVTGYVMQKTAGDWTAVAPSTVAASIALGDLQDVGSAAPTASQVLVGNGTSWNTTKIYHLGTFGTPSTSWVVTHSLGQKFCNVTVVDANDEVIIPQSIKFDSANQLTVTFNSNVAGSVVVMGIA